MWLFNLLDFSPEFSPETQLRRVKHCSGCSTSDAENNKQLPAPTQTSSAAANVGVHQLLPPLLLSNILVELHFHIQLDPPFTFSFRICSSGEPGGIGYIRSIQMLAAQKIHGAAEFRLKRHEECTKQHLVVRTAGGGGLHYSMCFLVFSQ